MTLNFSISDFVIDGKPITCGIADKILLFHIMPLQKVRDFLGKPIWISQKSGYRRQSWERARGRNGNSQHCFRGKGAVDLTWGGDIDVLLDAVVQNTKYKRMAVYYDNNQQFIHCDWKETSEGKRQIFKSTPASRWTLLKSF